MSRKTFFVTALILLFAGAVHAQNYSTALGARVGFFNGLTIKHFVSADNAIEGIAAFRWNGFILTGLYEWQKPIKGAPGLDYEVGIGGHVGFWDRHHYYWYDDDDPDDNITVAGLDFILGLEYTFKEVPFNLALDWKPAFNFIGDHHWWGDGVALSIRFTF
ncbi:hypothetical protein MASR1M74_26040 [Lentimicrobium sp.]